jgi:putative hydrolase of the HAD superfamily
MGAPALVLDFGGPVLVTPFELAAEQRDTPAHDLLAERGWLAPPERPDLEWEAVQQDRLTERAYWNDRAEEWSRAGGGEPDIKALIASLYRPPRPEMVRDEARSIIHDARVAGHPVGILTNDLLLFHSQEWVDQIEIPGEVDVLVDGSVEGCYKPDPRLYQIVADRLGVDFSDVVFLDDQATNIRGAEALGITSVWFDMHDVAGSFAAVRELLGLPEGGGDG